MAKLTAKDEEVVLDDVTVAICLPSALPPDSKATGLAATIVHCVNTHDKLVAALEKISNEPLGLVADKETAKQALAEAKETK